MGYSRDWLPTVDARAQIREAEKGFGMLMCLLGWMRVLVWMSDILHPTMAASLVTATLVRKQYALDSEIGSRVRSSQATAWQGCR